MAGSGRTDAGVHAEAQVAAFTIENAIPPDNLRRAMNRLLPPDIRILDAVETEESFHPRFDSVAKSYRYVIYRGETCPPFQWRYVHWHPYRLDEAKMAEGAKVFEGAHDFSRFSAKDESRAHRSKVRTIHSSTIERSGDLLIYTVRGDGFLKHMVRNLVGTLIEMGRGNLSPKRIPYRSGNTVPAKGLTMVSVEYPRVTLNP